MATYSSRSSTDTHAESRFPERRYKETEIVETLFTHMPKEIHDYMQLTYLDALRGLDLTEISCGCFGILDDG